MLRGNKKPTSRRSSLKNIEKKFLKVLSSSKNTKKQNDDGINLMRDEIRRSIVHRRSSLTTKEAFFLEELLICPELSVEVLMTTNEILNKSPLFNPDMTNAEEVRDDASTIDESKPRESIYLRRRSSIVSYEKHCRVEEELWRTKRGSTRSLLTSSTDDDSEIHESEEHIQSQPTKQTFFSKLFKSRILKPSPDIAAFQPSDNSIPFSILGAAMEDKSSWPRVLSPPLMDSIRPHMPFVVQNDNFWLKYSLLRDGGNLNTLLTFTRSSHRAVLAIETFDNEVFGVFTSSPWHHGGSQFYGSGEAFVWKLSQPRERVKTVDELVKRESDIEVFPWSQKNRNIQMSTPRKLVVGGGGIGDREGYCETREGDCETNEGKWTFALTLDSDLMRGETGYCVTFNSPYMAKSAERNDGIFEVKNIEVWTMTPVETVDLAEKLEFGRQFIFEHGAFVEY